jgi:hypothetical protein
VSDELERAAQPPALPGEQATGPARIRMVGVVEDAVVLRVLRSDKRKVTMLVTIGDGEPHEVTLHDGESYRATLHLRSSDVG